MSRTTTRPHFFEEAEAASGLTRVRQLGYKNGAEDFFNVPTVVTHAVCWEYRRMAEFYVYALKFR